MGCCKSPLPVGFFEPLEGVGCGNVDEGAPVVRRDGLGAWEGWMSTTVCFLTRGALGAWVDGILQRETSRDRDALGWRARGTHRTVLLPLGAVRATKCGSDQSGTRLRGPPRRIVIEDDDLPPSLSFSFDVPCARAERAGGIVPDPDVVDDPAHPRGPPTLQRVEEAVGRAWRDARETQERTWHGGGALDTLPERVAERLRWQLTEPPRPAPPLCPSGLPPVLPLEAPALPTSEVCDLRLEGCESNRVVRLQVWDRGDAKEANALPFPAMWGGSGDGRCAAVPRRPLTEADLQSMGRQLLVEAVIDTGDDPLPAALVRDLSPGVARGAWRRVVRNAGAVAAAGGGSRVAVPILLHVWVVLYRRALHGSAIGEAPGWELRAARAPHPPLVLTFPRLPWPAPCHLPAVPRSRKRADQLARILALFPADCPGGGGDLGPAVGQCKATLLVLFGEIHRRLWDLPAPAEDAKTWAAMAPPLPSVRAARRPLLAPGAMGGQRKGKGKGTKDRHLPATRFSGWLEALNPDRAGPDGPVALFRGPGPEGLHRSIVAEDDRFALVADLLDSSGDVVGDWAGGPDTQAGITAAFAAALRATEAAGDSVPASLRPPGWNGSWPRPRSCTDPEGTAPEHKASSFACVPVDAWTDPAWTGEGTGLWEGRAAMLRLRIIGNRADDDLDAPGVAESLDLRQTGGFAPLAAAVAGGAQGPRTGDPDDDGGVDMEVLVRWLPASGGGWTVEATSLPLDDPRSIADVPKALAKAHAEILGLQRAAAAGLWPPSDGAVNERSGALGQSGDPESSVDRLADLVDLEDLCLAAAQCALVLQRGFLQHLMRRIGLFAFSVPSTGEASTEVLKAVADTLGATRKASSEVILERIVTAATSMRAAGMSTRESQRKGMRNNKIAPLSSSTTAAVAMTGPEPTHTEEDSPPAPEPEGPPAAEADEGDDADVDSDDVTPTATDKHQEKKGQPPAVVVFPGLGQLRKCGLPTAHLVPHCLLISAPAGKLATRAERAGWRALVSPRPDKFINDSFIHERRYTMMPTRQRADEAAKAMKKGDDSAKRKRAILATQSTWTSDRSGSSNYRAKGKRIAGQSKDLIHQIAGVAADASVSVPTAVGINDAHHPGDPSTVHFDGAVPSNNSISGVNLLSSKRALELIAAHNRQRFPGGFRKGQFIRGAPLEAFRRDAEEGWSDETGPRRWPYPHYFAPPDPGAEPNLPFGYALETWLIDQTVADKPWVPTAAVAAGAPLPPLAPNYRPAPRLWDEGGSAVNLTELKGLGIVDDICRTQRTGGRHHLLTTWTFPWRSDRLWVWRPTRWLQQPVARVAQVYGTPAGYYFSFLSLYSKFLIYPAVLGIVIEGLTVGSSWMAIGGLGSGVATTDSFGGQPKATTDVVAEIVNQSTVGVDSRRSVLPPGSQGHGIALACWGAFVVVWAGCTISSWLTRQSLLGYLWENGLTRGLGRVGAMDVRPEFVTTIDRMMAESAEGEATALAWVREGLGLGAGPDGKALIMPRGTTGRQNSLVSLLRPAFGVTYGDNKGLAGPRAWFHFLICCNNINRNNRAARHKKTIAEERDRERAAIDRRIKRDMKRTREAYYMPISVRARRERVSLLVLVLFLILSAGVTALMLRIQDGIERGTVSFGSINVAVNWDPTIRRHASTIVVGTVNGLIIPQLAAIYSGVAGRFVDWELHRSSARHRAALSTKLAIFFIFNGNNSLFYLAFVKRDFWHLRTQIATFLVSQQVSGQLKEAVMPVALAWLKRRAALKKAVEARKAAAASQAVVAESRRRSALHGDIGNSQASAAEEGEAGHGSAAASSSFAAANAAAKTESAGTRLAHETAYDRAIASPGGAEGDRVREIADVEDAEAPGPGLVRDGHYDAVLAPLDAGSHEARAARLRLSRLFPGLKVWDKEDDNGVAAGAAAASSDDSEAGALRARLDGPPALNRAGCAGSLGEVLEQRNLPPAADLHLDQLEMLLQFSWLSMWSVAFPLGPAVSLINNLTEVRVDAAKMTLQQRQPVAAFPPPGGAWDRTFALVVVAALVTNTATLSFARLGPAVGELAAAEYGAPTLGPAFTEGGPTPLEEVTKAHPVSIQDVVGTVGIEHLVAALLVLVTLVWMGSGDKVQREDAFRGAYYAGIRDRAEAERRATGLGTEGGSALAVESREGSPARRVKAKVLTSLHE